MSSDYHCTIFGRQAFLTEVKRDWVLGNKKIREELLEAIRRAVGKTESALCVAQDDALDQEISVLIVGEMTYSKLRCISKI